MEGWKDGRMEGWKDKCSPIGHRGPRRRGESVSDGIARRWFCRGSAMIRRCHGALGIKGNMLLFPISKGRHAGATSEMPAH